MPAECACGCGQHPGTYAVTNITRGEREGAPRRFIPGHSNRTRPRAGGAWLYPKEPLARILRLEIAEHSLIWVARRTGLSSTTISRVADGPTRTVREQIADQILTGLGRHLSEVYDTEPARQFDQIGVAA